MELQPVWQCSCLQQLTENQHHRCLFRPIKYWCPSDGDGGAGPGSNLTEAEKQTHVILHGDIFSGQTQVGFGDARLDDHFFQELRVQISEDTHGGQTSDTEQ